LVETLTKDKSAFPFTSAGPLAIHGRDIYAGFGPQPGTNAVISYNVGEFLTDHTLQRRSRYRSHSGCLRQQGERVHCGILQRHGREVCPRKR
jgi:hypothetical protein